MIFVFLMCLFFLNNAELMYILIKKNWEYGNYSLCIEMIGWFTAKIIFFVYRPEEIHRDLYWIGDQLEWTTR